MSPIGTFKIISPLLGNPLVPKKEIDSIMSVFNSYDDRFMFTHELEKGNTLNFLDNSLIRNYDNSITKKLVSQRNPLG